jgi:urease accessory protein
MIRAEKLLPAESWSHDASDTVVLDFDRRHRRRIAMRGENGVEFLLDLAEATALKDGDGIVLEDGRTIEVRAANEPLAEITAVSPDQLVRLAWHLGNRHLPAALSGDRLFIRRDHVIEDMLESLGATVRHVEAPFDPEGGAYSHDDRPHSHG